MYCERMRELFDRWAASSFDKQERMLSLSAGSRWTCDLRGGRLRQEFGSGDVIDGPAQLLGRESECGRLWTWGWAYPPGEVAEAALACARRLRDWGRQRELLALIVPSYDLEGNCGHQLAMIASGILGARYYVEVETPEGSLYFVEEGPLYPPLEPPVERVFGIFPALVGHPDSRVTDQRLAFRSYLEYYGLEVEECRQPDGTVVSGKEPRGKRLVLGGFDERGRTLGLALGTTSRAVRRRWRTGKAAGRAGA